MSFAVRVEKFGHGKQIRVHTPALRCAFTTLGAGINSVKILDRKKDKWIEICCGFPCPEELDGDTSYMGPTVGRCAGRIGHGTFTLDGQKYEVQRNWENKHNLHAGEGSLHKRHWSFEPVETADVVGVRFSLVSPHMDLGFPAELHCFVYYYFEVSKPNVLHTEISARIPETSAGDATVVNMFSHPFWNLHGVPEENNATNPRWTPMEKVFDIEVKMPCSKVAVADKWAIPTGAFESVEGTCLDFRRGKPIGKDIDNVKVLDRNPCGYDHPLFVDGWSEKNKRQVLFNAEAYSPKTKIQMKVHSTYPCIWLYTANKMPEKVTHEKGQRYERYSVFYLDPQHLPDCANRPEFPSCVLRKGQTYFDKSVKEFNILNESRM